MEKITCTTCGKQFPLTPQLAGKKVRCMCGQVMTVPMPASRPDLDDDDEQYRLTPDPSHPPRKPAPPPVPQPPPKPTGPPVRRRLATVQSYSVPGNDAGGAIKLAIILGVMIVLLVGGIFVYKQYASKSASTRVALKGDDTQVLEMIDSEYNKEARAWLKEDDHRMLGGWNARQAMARIDDWYNMGAVKVICFSRMMSLVVAIELPSAPKPRADLFKWYTGYCREHFLKPQSDMGQRYLLVQVPR